MAAITDIGTLITQSPDVCSGRPRVAGTGVTVMRIAGWHKLGCEPEEIAHAVSFLASPLAGFITGELLDINGGLHLD